MSFSVTNSPIGSKRKLDHTIGNVKSQSVKSLNSCDSVKSLKSSKNSCARGLDQEEEEVGPRNEQFQQLIRCTQCKHECFVSDIVYKEESKENQHVFAHVICSWCALCESYGCGANRELDRILKQHTDCLSCSRAKLCAGCAQRNQTTVLVNNNHVFYDQQGHRYGFCSNCLRCIKCLQSKTNNIFWKPHSVRAEDILNRKVMCRTCEEASVHDELLISAKRLSQPSDFQGLLIAIEMQLKPRPEPVWEFYGCVESGYRIVSSQPSTNKTMLRCDQKCGRPAIFHLTVIREKKEKQLSLCTDCLIASTLPCTQCGVKFSTWSSCASCRTKVQVWESASCASCDTETCVIDDAKLR